MTGPSPIWVRQAATFSLRFRGLLGHPPPALGEGLWLSPCHQVHTFFMAYAIDVLHLDHECKVLAMATLKPWRLGRSVCGAASVLELRAGEARRLGISIGDRLQLESLKSM
ncbi:MAG: hypothetical protein A2341_22570 [Deltaproteobacteria bacterium RIFOXYB12_FULL_58_9]|nr:MAG: hypothetical protein A2341_22570 [Deltaproteobacteria bacterium RIFOXYB12_FULL_58_9]